MSKESQKYAAKKRVGKAEAEVMAMSLKDQELERYGGAVDQLERASFRGYSGLIALMLEDGELSENQARFLVEYAKDGLAVSACIRAGIKPNAYYVWCREPEFKAALEEARKVANESLERMAIDMASGVYKKPVVSGGVLVTEEEIRDTRMLAMMLRARMPDKYGTKVDVTSGGQSMIKVVDNETWDSV